MNVPSEIISTLCEGIWHICAKVTFTKQTKGSKVGFTHVEGSDLGHALMTWPKLLICQSMFFKFLSNFGNAKTFFLTGPKTTFRNTECHLLIHVQKVLAFPKWNWISKTSIGNSEVLDISGVCTKAWYFYQGISSF